MLERRTASLQKDMHLRREINCQETYSCRPSRIADQFHDLQSTLRVGLQTPSMRLTTTVQKMFLFPIWRTETSFIQDLVVVP
jgi:hypothetical protein